MAKFDYHTRRLKARLLVLGSDAAAARGLLGRWALSAGRERPAGEQTLRLPLVPLADLAGFDLEVEAEVECRGRGWAESADACVVVVGQGVLRSHNLLVLQRRASEEGGSGPVLWAAHGGWNDRLSQEARRLGVQDDVLRAQVGSAEGALTCLEVALTCLVDHLLLRVHPASWGEGAPEPAAVLQRLRAWARNLTIPGGLAEEIAASGAPALAEPGRAGAPGEGWRRRALDLEGVEPLRAAEAELDAQTLEQILKLTPAEPARLRRSEQRDSDTRRSGRGTRRR